MKKFLCIMLLLPISFVVMAQGGLKSSMLEKSEEVFSSADKMPEFPGGMAAMQNYLATNVQYPLEAQEKGIQGRVICQFIINTDGTVSDVKVMRNVDKLLEAEAIRVIENMPKWNPGIKDNKIVRVKYTLPITFRLQTGE
jgi:protein TonB